MGIPNHGQCQLEDIPIFGLFNHELFNHELLNQDLDFSIPFMLIIEELMVEKSGVLSQGRRLGLTMIAPKFVEVWLLVMK